MNDQGTPMMLMGDEYGHTRNGNNNSYGHDTAINNFLWDQASLLHPSRPIKKLFFNSLSFCSIVGCPEE